ncbi:MAG: RagB/SusD family nutrient uptake outer membrane protein [Bacteroidia bacterium]|nr:RagB/SusD family nutrient uptake outer membrane protein [Bacteroidia bacterium]
MRRYSIVAILLFGLFVPLANQSCTNLDEELFTELTSDNFPQTDDEFISALGAAYTSLYGLMNHNALFSAMEVSSDEAMIPQRGADWFDGGQWLRMHRHEMNPNEESILGGWNFCYNGISNCNRLVELFEGLVESGQVSASEAAGFIGELKTLRALFYYWLLDVYGNVPIVTSFSSADAQPATVLRGEVFNFIVSELEANVPNLTRERNGQTYARVNYYVGKAIEAKLYLNAEVYTGTAQWAKAAAAADEIINSGLYSLEGNYFDNFSTENAGSSENIFVVPYDQVFAQGFNLPQMTLHYGSQFTFDLQQQPWNGYCSLQEFYNAYEANDIRRDGPVSRGYGNFISGPQFESDGSSPVIDPSAEANDPDGAQLNFTPAINEHFPNCLRQAGVRMGKFEFAIGATPNLDNDFPIFRYADIMLVKAEAALRQGNTGDALALVNQVRARAGVADLGALTADDLLAERGREMFYEGWRRQDLIRFGKWTGTWDFKPASSPNTILMPIPANQLNANPNLTQNAGY